MNQKKFTRRVYVTGLLVIAISVIFIFKLFTLHFTSKIAITKGKDTFIQRGHIKDTNDYILAISIEKKSLFANPERIQKPAEIAKKLSPIIGMSERFILNRIQRKKRFIWIKRKLDSETVRKIKKLNLKGIQFKKEYLRVYPHGRLASNILGFVGIDNNGLEGLEYKYNDVLTVGITGEFPEDMDFSQGNSIKLTIDKTIQYNSEKVIKEGVLQYGAKQGAIIVLEIRTGKVLAIAKYPDFDPNNYYQYSSQDRRNFTIVDAFEPGSTLKVFGLAAILENAKPGGQKEFICKGKIDIGDATINCSKTHGRVTLTDIIAYSCNAGIIQAMKRVKKKSFYNLMHRFGFGKIISIGIPGEHEGILRPWKKWSGLSKYSISIGQEISVTSLQLIAAFGAIANGGVYRIPTLIESIEKNDGTIVQGFYPKSRGKVLNEKISKKILETMKAVTTVGTGKNARLTYYTVAGKTGTSQKSKKRGGYYKDKVIVSFIGITPVESPELCILVVLDEPNGEGASGGQIAAPLFARVARQVLPYKGIKLGNVSVKGPGTTTLRKWKNIHRIPDFRNMRLSDALQILAAIQKQYSINYSIIGSGRVYGQSPEPNLEISKNQRIVLYLRK